MYVITNIQELVQKIIHYTSENNFSKVANQPWGARINLGGANTLFSPPLNATLQEYIHKVMSYSNILLVEMVEMTALK